MSNSYKAPSWWNENYSSGWERTKEALRRDWEQTKADVTDGGTELNQDVGDTVKQAAGKQAIPPANRPNPPDSWDEAEPAVRYGYGARQHFEKAEWDDELESRLQKDWDSTGNVSSWERVKAAVRRGWDSVKRAAA
ncbi:MAG TPA: hypothetical protein VIW29_06810 [Polyangiaceae bacterium]